MADSRPSRAQLNDAASSTLGSADRNLFLEGGGLILWDETTGRFDNAEVFHVTDFQDTATNIATIAVDTWPTGIALLNPRDALWFAFSHRPRTGAETLTDTTLAGSTARTFVATIDGGATDGEKEFMLCMRGWDDRLYFRDGSVATDGIPMQLGEGGAPSVEWHYTVLGSEVGVGADPGVGSFEDGSDLGSATKIEIPDILFPWFPLGALGMRSLSVFRNGQRLLSDYEGYATLLRTHPYGDYHIVEHATRTGFSSGIQLYTEYLPAAGEVLTFRVTR